MNRMLVNSRFRNGRRIAGKLLTSLVLITALSCTAAAVNASPPRPDSGTVLEGAKPPEKPVEQSDTADLKVVESKPVSADNTQRIRVNRFRFSGELPVPEADLQQVAAGQVGKDLTLNDLNQLAAQITHCLRGRGYSVATAYIPAQTITDGQVEIAVIPGKYGAIIINNQAGLTDQRLAKMIAGLKEGDIVTQAELERTLLLIKDLPGVNVQANLAPGQTAGTTELTLNISDTAKYTGSLYTDNSGNRYTGAIRGGFSTSVANPSHSGDTLQIGGQTAGHGLKGCNLDYNLPLGYRGAKLAFAYSRVDYTLGKDFKVLNANGDTTVAGLTASYPFRRSRNANFYGTIGFDYKDLNDEISGWVTPKADRIWKLGLNGNFNDRRRGVNRYDLTYWHGNFSIGAATIDSNKTVGGFNKLTFNYRRQQALNQQSNLGINFSSQLSDSNLDSSEKFYLGGADGVRAYPQGEAASDQGSLLTVELNRSIPKWSNGQNQISLVGFSDLGFGELNRHQWNGPGADNHRNLADVGLGLRWLRRNFNLRLDYAVKVGGEDAESDPNHDRSGRIWLQCVRYF